MTYGAAREKFGLTNKIHAVVDSSGLPVRLALTTGDAHDNRLAAKLVFRLKSGSMLLADRGYDADHPLLPTGAKRLHRTSTFLNCQGSDVSISSGNRPGRSASGVQSV